jgi:hypothetical protein
MKENRVSEPRNISGPGVDDNGGSVGCALLRQLLSGWDRGSISNGE